MTIEITVLISITTALLGAALGVAGYKRTSKREATEEGKNDGVLLTDMGYVKAGVDDIKQEQRQAGKQHAELVKEVSMMQRDLKTAFNRIDDNRKGIDEVKKDIRAYHQN